MVACCNFAAVVCAAVWPLPLPFVCLFAFVLPARCLLPAADVTVAVNVCVGAPFEIVE